MLINLVPVLVDFVKKDVISTAKIKDVEDKIPDITNYITN